MLLLCNIEDPRISGLQQTYIINGFQFMWISVKMHYKLKERFLLGKTSNKKERKIQPIFLKPLASF